VWLTASQENWSLIDKHGADILRFGNVQEIKNDKKILTQIHKLWQDYITSVEKAINIKDSE
jgi:hypothetical protein